jgi:hypothetical protein
MLPTKFLRLKRLVIDIPSGDSLPLSYDYLSLVSFLDASPSLETLILNVRRCSFIAGILQIHASISLITLWIH